MQPVTILTDNNVKQILHDLRKKDVEAMMTSLETALHQYSLGTGNECRAASNQPARTTLESANGSTTQFMPSMTPTTLGIKVVTVTGAQDKPDPDFDDFDSHSINPPSSVSPRGALTILSSTGDPLGFVNAEELTAFRTALTSSLLLNRRRKVKTLTVFGCGKQAYWHVRLALLLHGHTIKHVHFVNRDFSDNASNIMEDFYRYNPLIREREGWSHTDFSILTPYYEEYNRVIKEQVRAADVIIGCTPSTEPLFDHTILTNTEGRQKGRLFIAVGSYRKSMIEIPPEIIFQAVKRHGYGHHHHKRVQEGGAIIVDTLACRKSTGELSQANLEGTEIVELGELVMLEHMDSPSDDASGSSSSQSMEKLSLGGETPSNSMPRTFSFGRRSSSMSKNDTPSPAMSKSDTVASDSSSSLHGHHSLAHIFPHHFPYHLSKIFHKKEATLPHVDTTSSDTTSTPKSPNASTPSLSSQHRDRHTQKSTNTSTHSLPSQKIDRHNSTPSLPSQHLERQNSNASSLNQERHNSFASSLSFGKNSEQHKKKKHVQTAKETEMADWLSKGNVVYKSIGLGLTDLVVGGDLVALARERGVGITIERF